MLLFFKFVIHEYIFHFHKIKSNISCKKCRNCGKTNHFSKISRVNQKLLSNKDISNNNCYEIDSNVMYVISKHNHEIKQCNEQIIINGRELF